MKPKLALVVPLWNQWDATRLFLESLEGQEPFSLILVDNGSTDFTARGLNAFKGRLKFKLIKNRVNRGCAPAWNQGVREALRQGAEWIGIFNNDLLLAPGSLARLLRRAEAKGWDLASPATREGALDYDFEAYAAAYMRRCMARDEAGWFGWCFIVRAAVFKKLGLFDEGFKLGIGEDEDFARRMRGSGMRLGITGSAFVHHFGSQSLKVLRREKGKGFEEENLKKLRARWGVDGRRSPAARLKDALMRGWSLLRWGHLLKEGA